MLKKVNFTAEEADWLTRLLLQRISLYGERSSPRPKVIDHCISAMLKLEEKHNVSLKDWEKTMCISVVNENLPVYYKQVEVTDAFSLITMTTEQRTILDYIDMGKSVLKKLRKDEQETLPDYNLNTSYREKYQLLEKLKSCDLIYISRSGEDNVYKIGFVYQSREASVYRLSNEIRPDDLAFYALKMDAIKYGKQRFTLVTDRCGAFDLLSKCDECNYPANQLNFFKQLLN
ncbi:hypothetical protein [Pedobacter sp. GR22-6]|uniref:hypothetical protein n=1 Tax=Pedobacter sp. GR22-6 TaxID=3127957 RepID=UPI00307DC000